MIFRTEVKREAEAFLNETFKDKLEAKRYLLDPSRWDIWLDLMRDRVNQIDIMFVGKGIKLSWPQVAQFIQQGVLAYALAQVSKRK